MRNNQHGGDIYQHPVRCDFSANINPYGMPERVREVLRRSVDGWSCYPDPECRELIQKLSSFHQVPAAAVCCGNGAVDLIYRIVQITRPVRALVPAPTFSEYEQALLGAGCEVEYFYLSADRNFVPDWDGLLKRLSPRLDLLFFCNPNNPTGIPMAKEKMRELAQACRKNNILLVVDECFCDFLDAPRHYSLLSDIGRFPQLLVLKAFTKTYAMAGLRLGYGISTDCDLIRQLRRSGPPWSVSLPAQQAGTAALKEHGYLARTIPLIAGQRGLLKQGLARLGYQVYASQANYIFFKVPGPEPCGRLGELLKARGILIRDCSNYRGLTGGYYRIAVKTAPENQFLLETLKEIRGTGDII